MRVATHLGERGELDHSFIDVKLEEGRRSTLRGLAVVGELKVSVRVVADDDLSRKGWKGQPRGSKTK